MTERLEFDIMELVDMLPTTDDGAAKLDFHEWQEPTACAASCAGMFLNASGVVRTPENSQKAIHEEIYDPHWGGDPPGGCPPERMVKFLSKFYEDGATGFFIGCVACLNPALGFPVPSNYFCF